ncbi:ADP-ribosylglycohydrolase family protein [Paenibacillus sp. MBLB4367]|uniref:ADP-ribosylglycohydrolase family protein n=1 Tax=Paenibacillus sp. MBLB4367 TaxID=3384767 RepID=UPI0039082096
MSLENRIKGGLFGVAVGDALGGTTEFMSAGEIRQQYGYLMEIIGGGVWNLQPGEVTDDTMMTIGVAEGILERPEEPIPASAKGSCLGTVPIPRTSARSFVRRSAIITAIGSRLHSWRIWTWA